MSDQTRIRFAGEEFYIAVADVEIDGNRHFRYVDDSGGWSFTADRRLACKFSNRDDAIVAARRAKQYFGDACDDWDAVKVAVKYS